MPYLVVGERRERTRVVRKDRRRQKRQNPSSIDLRLLVSVVVVRLFGAFHAANGLDASEYAVVNKYATCPGSATIINRGLTQNWDI